MLGEYLPWIGASAEAEGPPELDPDAPEAPAATVVLLLPEEPQPPAITAIRTASASGTVVWIRSPRWRALMSSSFRSDASTPTCVVRRGDETKVKAQSVRRWTLGSRTRPASSPSGTSRVQRTSSRSRSACGAYRCRPRSRGG